MKKYTLAIILGIFFLAAFLRTYKIATNPPGLYIDEVSIAYNAYSILTTGKDEHGQAYPFVFKAYGEYKMPVYIYLTSLSMAAFGKNEFAVRFPSALFGILSVILFYFFAKELIRYEKGFNKAQAEAFSIIGTFLLAISPWHIQFSRAGFESTVALFFFLLGIFLFLYFYRTKKNVFIFFSFLSLIITIYTYDAFKVIAPISLGFLILVTYLKIPVKRKFLLVTSFAAFFFALPMILFSLTNAGLARFSQVTAFSSAGNNGKLFFLAYPIQYINNYLSYFSLNFLFSYGDGIGRHTVFRMGPLFKWQIIFLLSGIYFFVKERFNFFKGVVLFLLFSVPLAGALAVPSPHLLRSEGLVIPLTLLIAYGVVKIWMLKERIYKMVFVLVFFLAIFEFGLYLDYYYNDRVVVLADWGNEYKELINKVASQSNKNTVVIINNDIGMNTLYIKFYDDEMTYRIVGGAWYNSKELPKGNILYVSLANDNDRQYLKSIPHKLVGTITTPDKYQSPLYEIWKI